ncbi:uncharacterized protein VTP21DRAFT_7634 [Calcarisporiella thermophila]|uniref:uncharacterized protein n=1 Tax=Calcarisporiella thermophila TaxID=911321 RepID=UPI0037426C8A
MTLQLEFQRQIVTELLAEDGLLILARGLGLPSILCALLQIYSAPEHLVLLLNTNQEEETALREELAVNGVKQPGLRVINNETPASERSEIYKSGGILSITSRILIVDMLNKSIPTHIVSGILVNHAERVTTTSTEAFILRVFREENKEGFIKAFSDNPEQFVSGFAPLQKTLKLLHLRKVYLWPRFHLFITENLEKRKADVVELRQPLSDAMRDIQSATIECMETCLSELKRANPTIDIVDFNVENALFKSFDSIVRQQLDPIWHRVSVRTKQLVGDLKTLRRLLTHLLSYDCVTFNSLLETILASNIPSSTGTRWNHSPWLLTDAANVIFSEAKNRLYIKDPSINDSDGNSIEFPPDIMPVLEEQPKWKLLSDVMDEIEEDIISFENEPNDMTPNTVLIMVQDERTCFQIQDYLSQRHKRRAVRGREHHPMLLKYLRRYFKWKKGIVKVRKNLFNADTPNSSHPTEDANGVRGSSGKRGAGRGGTSERGGTPFNKRRRVRGGSVAASMSRTTGNMETSFDQEIRETAEFMNSNDDDANCDDPLTPDDFDASMFSEHYGLLPLSSLVLVRPHAGDADDRMLRELRPRFIVMYDPDPSFVRRVEVYRASHSGQPVRVYFMVYDGSVEEQRYLSTIRREKDAFERLIREKSVMAIPLADEKATAQDDFLRIVSTRTAGGRAVRTDPGKIVVDMREFRSSLPSVLHARKLQIIPCTLQIGDYVLSPTVCVERKSVTDLVQSLNSGRLYSQCEAMCAYYKCSVLLIEFDEGKSFSLQALGDMKSDITLSDIQSKLALLLIAFPRLRLMWSSSAHATAEMFEDLKTLGDEPDAVKAAGVGVVEGEEIDSEWNLTPMDMLRSIPGITSKNYKHVLQVAGSMAELAEMSVEQLKGVIGEVAAKKVWGFFRQDAKA